MSVEQTFFQPFVRDVVTAGGACDQTLTLPLTLAPRARTATPSGAGLAPSVAETAAPLDAASTTSNDAELARLLPPGFSAETAASDAVAINGSGGAAMLDRRMLNDRFEAIERGEFDPANGGFAPGGPGGPGGFGGAGRPGFSLAVVAASRPRITAAPTTPSASSSSTNGFSGVTDVAGLAGIAYPPGASLDTLNWGVPNLSFSTLTGVSLNAATARSDDRLTLS